MGSKGEACKVWQMFFNDKGKAGLVTDGICGPKTIAFAKMWQASAGLTPDGLLGPMSRAKAAMMQ
jgi:peptidoglycan hydrolase-like protein with peptidoglycan-binding domain